MRADTLTSSDPLPTGKVNVRLDFVADEPGKRATGGKTLLFVNDKKVAEGTTRSHGRFPLLAVCRHGHRP